MNTKIQKWGNSLGLRIPKSFAEEAGVEAGSEVDLTVEDGQLIVRGKQSEEQGLSLPGHRHPKEERVRRVGIASKTDASKTETCN